MIYKALPHSLGLLVLTILPVDTITGGNTESHKHSDFCPPCARDLSLCYLSIYYPFPSPSCFSCRNPPTLVKIIKHNILSGQLVLLFL